MAETVINNAVVAFVGFAVLVVVAACTTATAIVTNNVYTLFYALFFALSAAEWPCSDALTSKSQSESRKKSTQSVWSANIIVATKQSAAANGDTHGGHVAQQ